MSEYFCEECNYSTDSLYNFNRHKKSLKHVKKVNEKMKVTSCYHQNIIFGGKVSERKNIKKENKNIKYKDNIIAYEHICMYCGCKFNHRSNLSRHMKSCLVRTNMDKVHDDKLKLYDNKVKILKDKDQMNSEKIKILTDEIDNLKSVINSAGIIAKSSVSALSYLIKNHNSAPVLKKITSEECKKLKGNDNSNEKFVNELIDYHYDNTLADHIGDFIVRTYKMNDKDEQSIWNSDTSRLTYIIRESFNKQSAEWLIDKRGTNTKEYIIDPIMDYLKDCVNKHFECLNVMRRDNNITPEETDKIIKRMNYMIEILCQINNRTLHKNVLKYIAPEFYLHKK